MLNSNGCQLGFAVAFSFARGLSGGPIRTHLEFTVPRDLSWHSSIPQHARRGLPPPRPLEGRSPVRGRNNFEEFAILLQRDDIQPLGCGGIKHPIRAVAPGLFGELLRSCPNKSSFRKFAYDFAYDSFASVVPKWSANYPLGSLWFSGILGLADYKGVVKPLDP